MDYYGELLDAYQNAKYGLGDGPLTEAWKVALESEVPNPVEQFGDNRQFQLLAALCRELQRLNGDDPIFITCSAAGDLLGVSAVTAWKWLRVLVKMKVLSIVEKGNRHRATRFRYLRPLED